MGLIVQFQRRAIEALRHEAEAIPPNTIQSADIIHASDGSQLYFVGISPGYGTCSDVPDMDVLVLSELPTGLPAKLGRSACAYTVLVRSLTEKEVYDDALARQGVARRCVELLEPLGQIDTGQPAFARTGKTSIYTKLASA